MSPVAWEILGGVIAQLVVAIWSFGRLSERVRNHGGWLSALSEKVDDHGTRIAVLEGREGVKRR